MLIKDARFCVIDVESTGLDAKRDEIIAFASVPVEALRIKVHSACYTLVRPRGYKIESMKYHGISARDLEAAPTFAEVADLILRGLEGILVGHSVEFDYALLLSHFNRAGASLKRDVLDVVMIERWLGRKCGKMGLDLTFDAMLKRYGLKEYYRHNALSDAFYTAQIFQMQILGLSRVGVETVSQLKKLVKSCRYALW